MSVVDTLLLFGGVSIVLAVMGAAVAILVNWAVSVEIDEIDA